MKGIALDRDGTLIDVVRDEEIGAISVAFHPSQLRLLTGAVEGLRLLVDAGYHLAIASNQPGPAKGQFSADAVRRTNDALVALLAGHGIPIDAVVVCMHHPDGGPGGDPSLVGLCDCRKPKAGLLTRLLAEQGWDPGASWMIGDSPSDVEAGRTAGLSTALVWAENRCELCPMRPLAPGEPPRLRATPTVTGATLESIARRILVR